MIHHYGQRLCPLSTVIFRRQPGKPVERRGCVRTNITSQAIISVSIDIGLVVFYLAVGIASHAVHVLLSRLLRVHLIFLETFEPRRRADGVARHAGISTHGADSPSAAAVAATQAAYARHANRAIGSRRVVPSWV